MGLTEDERKAVVSLRLDNAKRTLEDAKIIANNKLWKAAANRLYYACFYAAGALMVKFGFEAKTHAGIIRLLGLNFVSKNIISNDLGDLYYKLFTLRQKGDYDDWVVVKEEDIVPLFEPAEQFIAEIEQLIFNF
ncbi:MAG: HEPN domain-containing protein [Bacteroidales bacterium]|nr:HEPN domain-containing protein [Bacteroidales bacterium]